ncbi:MAG: M48 family metallopeptidase [Wenzhouxiangellaceae bacterium]|nr:M48 family metallopeptidase [Wenzhouxiangellaceae bacterium]
MELFGKSVIGATLLATLIACATSPLGRSQFVLIPSEDMARIGQNSFVQLKQQQPILDSGPQVAYVQCVADAITPLVETPSASAEWEIAVFRDDTANAFALPGGKIGVYTGMLNLLEGQAELATIIGHEIAHVVSRHGAERVSQQFAASQAMQLTEALVVGQQTSTSEQQLMGLLGLGVQVGVMLPYSRTHEREADLVGLDLMAEAGFDPRAAIEVWQKMEQRSDERPAEWLSTHPHPQSRIDELRERMPDAIALYEQARSQGRRPDCR